MIDFYYWPTPNGWKVAIMLEECSLDYRMIPVNIGRGDQFKPEFLAISTHGHEAMSAIEYSSRINSRRSSRRSNTPRQRLYSSA